MSDLKLILDRVREAKGPDRELDEAISAALFPEQRFAQLADAPEGTGCMMYWQNGRWESALRVTSSLDAAVGLVEKVLPGWFLTLDRYSISDNPSHESQRFNWRVWLKYIDTQRSRVFAPPVGLGPTPALALCAALLSAKLQHGGGQ